jgi:predicted unusual protein kinase regulating ubiquinone biosynthesis (AarF/ABC1/UbiB family)
MAERPHLKGIASRWAGRTLATARVGAEVGRAAARKVVDKALDRLDDDWDGEALAERLDGLKGLSMKLGQMASYLDGAVPESAQKALRRLQSQSRPIEWAVVEASLAEAYGRPASEVFAAFEHHPFAAASIGQVHRARAGDREVAVKVQYPEIARAIEVDLGNLGRLGLFGSLGSAVASGPLVQELRERLREECDYRQEAANQLYFRELFAGDARLLVPEVLADLVRERVLVSEFVTGRSFHDFLASASQQEKNRAGLLIYEFAWQSIWTHSLFNGDPHPGNYLFLDDGRVAFLDFGCVRGGRCGGVEALRLRRPVAADGLPVRAHAGAHLQVHARVREALVGRTGLGQPEHAPHRATTRLVAGEPAAVGAVLGAGHARRRR